MITRTKCDLFHWHFCLGLTKFYDRCHLPKASLVHFFNPGLGSAVKTDEVFVCMLLAYKEREKGQVEEIMDVNNKNSFEKVKPI